MSKAKLKQYPDIKERYFEDTGYMVGRGRSRAE